MNIDTKFRNKVLANWIQEHIKIITKSKLVSFHGSKVDLTYADQYV